MKLFKLAVILSAFVLISTAAWAGNIPEYDAVGTDRYNFYSLFTVYYNLVNFGPNYGLEKDSDFFRERFNTNAGMLQDSPCYSRDRRLGEDIESSEFFMPPQAALTDVWNEGTYEWWIVLQMKPESDINLNIYDCVLKHNETDLHRFADQTGRYRMPWGELRFNAAWNPLVSAAAVPGPFATTAFAEWYSESGDELILDARTLPGLVNVSLDSVSYTSKAHWPEGIVMAMPKTGVTNQAGQMEYNLKQGDLIHVTLEIPPDTNTVDVWYGPDSVILKYIGIINTEYFAND
jgi:hypothetical protein